MIVLMPPHVQIHQGCHFAMVYYGHRDLNGKHFSSDGQNDKHFKSNNEIWRKNHDMVVVGGGTIP